MEEMQNLKQQGGYRILVVDDEEFLVKMWKMCLERRGYRVTTFINSVEALKEYNKSPEAYDLAITDQTMPGMTGIAFAKELLKIRSDMPIILCTGYSDLVNDEIAKKAGIREFIMKPFDINQLEIVMKRILP